MRRYHWGFNLQFPKLRLISIILCSLLNIVFGSFTNLLEFHSPIFNILLFPVNILFIIVSCSKIHADNSDIRFLQVSFCCLLFLLALFHGALFPWVLEQLTLMSLCSFVEIWSLELKYIPLLRTFYTYSSHVPTALPVFSEWNKFTLVMRIWKAALQRASLWLQFFGMWLLLSQFIVTIKCQIYLCLYVLLMLVPSLLGISSSFVCLDLTYAFGPAEMLHYPLGRINRYPLLPSHHIFCIISI